MQGIWVLYPNMEKIIIKMPKDKNYYYIDSCGQGIWFDEECQSYFDMQERTKDNLMHYYFPTERKIFP